MADAQRSNKIFTVYHPKILRSLAKEVKMTETGKTKKGGKSEIPGTLPILVGETILFPKLPKVMDLAHRNNIRLVEDVVKQGDKFIGIIRDGYQIGTVAEMKKVTHSRLRNIPREIQINVKGLQRFKIIEMLRNRPYRIAKIKLLPDQEIPKDKITALLEALKTAYEKFLDTLNFPDRGNIKNLMRTSEDIEYIVNFMINYTPDMFISLTEKQKFLEVIDFEQRLKEATRLLYGAISKIEAEQKVRQEMTQAIDESVIREQIAILQRKIGEYGDVEKYREKIKQAQMTPEAEKEALAELDRLSSFPPYAPESGYITTWLDWMCSLPWQKCTKDELDIKGAEGILNGDHYALEKVKRRVLEFLAVRKLGGGKKGPILCFIGPPGTGKTSVGKSIARAMGRKFVRISLGGVYDEAQIRGHRRTYVGALPGIIIAQIKNAGVKNPVFMIDEIDKIGTDRLHGDPSSALLEALDPEQNNTFSDHYLGVPFDLSEVMFICTGNWPENIQPALHDRMEIIEFPGYTGEEKLEIAKRYLAPRQLEANGLTAEQLQLEDKTLQLIIRDYTAEAGVRNLEREIGSICRHIATEIAKGEKIQTVIKEDDLPRILGPKKYLPQLMERISRPGVATGLAWTPFGGEILFIEAEIIRGVSEPELKITGNIQKVMKESAMAALTFTEANLDMLGILPERSPIGHKIHIHVPEAAVSKDGPSAGLAIFVAIVSLLKKLDVRDDVALSGEITLRGKVLAVGGIKEKIIAAKEAGIKTIIIPKDNEGDLQDLPQSVKEAIDRGEIEIKLVSEMKKVLEIAVPEPKDVEYEKRVGKGQLF